MDNFKIDGMISYKKDGHKFNIYTNSGPVKITYEEIETVHLEITDGVIKLKNPITSNLTVNIKVTFTYNDVTKTKNIKIHFRA